MSDLTVEEDDTTVVLMCKVHGKPEPTVSWSKDNTTVRESENLRITSDQEVQKITFLKISKQMAGKYSCEAENKLGSAKTSCNVIVNGN